MHSFAEEGVKRSYSADVHGVRASLSEQGAHRVGKDYEVEPVAVSARSFSSEDFGFCGCGRMSPACWFR